MRSHHGELCKVLTVSSTTLSSLTLELFSKKIIELDVKTDVLEKGGVHGADTLLTHVLIKSKHNPKHLNVVQEALEKQSTLDEITEKMRNSCVTGKHCNFRIVTCWYNTYIHLICHNMLDKDVTSGESINDAV